MIRRMQRRLTAVLLLFLVGIYGGFCAVSVYTSAGALERETQMQLRRLAEPGPDMFGQLEDVRGGEGQVRLPYFVMYTDGYGAVVNVDQGQFQLDGQQLKALAEAVLTAREDSGYLKEAELLYCRVTVLGGWKIVFMDDSMQRELHAGQIRSSVLLGVVLLPVFALFSWLLAAFITRPVRRAWEKQTQFVADASHELKTPLTVILSNADMVLADCPAGDDALRRRMDAVRLEAHRMRGLVLDMLELARGDVRLDADVPRTVIDLSAAVENAALSFEAVAYEQGLGLESEVAEGVCILGHEAGVSQLLAILLDNAVKYSLPGGTIRVRLQRERGRFALLTVVNPSESLEREQLEKLFDRFYRVDKARSLQPGYGLGLSVARQITERLEGRIWAEHRDGFTRLAVRLPVEK